MPSSSLLRSFALLLAAGAISQQQVDAVVCEGTEDTTDVSMSCGELFNTCTSSGLCVVGTDSKCCSVNTDSKDKTSCVQKDFVESPYTTTCDEMGITAVCSGTEDKTDFTNSCGGLVDSCTGSGLCVVNQEGVCCSVYTDADEKESTDCVPMGDYTSTCEKGDVGIETDGDPTASPVAAATGAPTKSPTMAPTKSPTPAESGAPTASPVAAATGAQTKSPTMAPTKSPTLPPAESGAPTASPVAAATGAPTKSPTMAPTKSPTPAESGCSRKDAAGLVLGSFISLILASVAF